MQYVPPLHVYEKENHLNAPLIDPKTIPSGFGQHWDEDAVEYLLYIP